MIDGIDVVATLIPEDDAWQFNAAETSTTDIQLLNRDQDTIAEVDCDDSKASEAREAFDARTGEKLDPAEVRELDEFEVIMEVGESELWATSGKKIWSKWVETRKDPASPAVRCRLCPH